MVRVIDVKGLSCPLPVMKVKEVIDAGDTEIIVLANEAVVVNNVQRLAENNDYAVLLEKRFSGEILIRMKKK